VEENDLPGLAVTL